MTTLTTASEQSRAALRREHGVRLVSPAQEGFAAEQLPAGTFGFTSSPALASPLFAERQYRNFEIHRLANDVTVVGFVTPDHAGRLTRMSGGDPVTVTLYPDAEDDATAIVSLPYGRVVQHRQYSVRNSAAIVLQVLPSGQAAAV